MIRGLAAAAALGLAGCASAPEPVVDPVAELAAEHPLGFLFGEWVGTASGQAADGTSYSVTRTERVGPVLGGDAVIIESLGYAADGRAVQSAFAVVSPTAANGNWEIRQYADGDGGTFPLEPTSDGFVWTVPFGTDGQIWYRSVVQDGRWVQTGDFTPADGEPRRVMSMSLSRVGSTAWPSGGAIQPFAEE